MIQEDSARAFHWYTWTWVYLEKLQKELPPRFIFTWGKELPEIVLSFLWSSFGECRSERDRSEEQGTADRTEVAKVQDKRQSYKKPLFIGYLPLREFLRKVGPCSKLLIAYSYKSGKLYIFLYFFLECDLLRGMNLKQMVMFEFLSCVGWCNGPPPGPTFHAKKFSSKNCFRSKNALLNSENWSTTS